MGEGGQGEREGWVNEEDKQAGRQAGRPGHAPCCLESGPGLLEPETVGLHEEGDDNRGASRDPGATRREKGVERGP